MHNGAVLLRANFVTLLFGLTRAAVALSFTIACKV
jgi:hypothetical protein